MRGRDQGRSNDSGRSVVPSQMCITIEDETGVDNLGI